MTDAARPFVIRPRRSVIPRGGFTLVEMLVGAVVTLVVCFLVAEMSMSLVGGVGTASGRVTAAQKLDFLRARLGDDLARLPQLPDGTDRLLAWSDDEIWQLQLALPSRPERLRLSGEAWEKVRYSWERGRGALLRQMQKPDGRYTDPEIIVSGVVELRPEFLTGPADTAEVGEPDWDRTSLPAFLRIHPRLTDVWEEGRVDERAAAEGRIIRDFEAIIPIASIQ